MKERKQDARVVEQPYGGHGDLPRPSTVLSERVKNRTLLILLFPIVIAIQGFYVWQTIWEQTQDD